jgi:hypothetical protein
MKAVVILWLIVFSFLLTLTIYYKDHTEVAEAAIIETDCVGVKGSHPCVTKVRYDVGGSTYVQQLGVQSGESSLLGKKIRIRYNRMTPNLIREYKSHINVFAIPTVVWFLLGICVLYFMYTPSITPAGST